MKIWLRINRLDISCSWTFVYQELKEAFELEGHTVYADINKPPENPEEYIEFWWTDPREWNWSNEPVALRVGYALSETHSFLKVAKKEIIYNATCCDLLLCPTYSAAIAYMEAPIDIPIEIVPFGVNPQTICYVERDWHSPVFRFLHLGVAQFRKGSWMVPEAFIKAFGAKPGVHLTISAFRDTQEGVQLEREYSSHPNIQFYRTCHPSPMSMYSSHHVLVSPHLAEGWGLCIPEAMMSGMTCLVARCSAPREYFSNKYGWWIEMSEDYAPVSKSLEKTAGFWRVPDIHSLVELYKYTYEHREECREKGRKASVYVLNNLTWRRTVRQIVNLIKQYTSKNTIEWR